MAVAPQLRALVVTLDPNLAKAFGDVSRDLGIEARPAIAASNVVNELGREKYDAVLLDFDTVDGCNPILSALRRSASNRGAVVFAVATAGEHKKQAVGEGFSVLLQRPVAPGEIRRAMTAAHAIMVRERRQYFRCQAELEVFISRSDLTGIIGKTLNVSSRGAAVLSSANFLPTERVGVSLKLPGNGRFSAKAIVVWDDGHGKTGLNFLSVNPVMQAGLDDWLDCEFARLR